MKKFNIVGDDQLVYGLEENDNGELSLTIAEYAKFLEVKGQWEYWQDCFAEKLHADWMQFRLDEALATPEEDRTWQQDKLVKRSKGGTK